MALPIAVTQALETLLTQAGGKTLAKRSEAVSDAYRQAMPTRKVMLVQEDALAYAATRMPATAAAVGAVLAGVVERAPGFKPRSLVDVGSGPGTASWVASEFWHEMDVRLLDDNLPLLTVAEALAAQIDEPVFNSLAVERANIVSDWRVRDGADLVLASYALTELDEDDLRMVIERLWSATRGMLVLVEPGRPREFRRLMGIREQLLQLGAKVVAPCPHEFGCPLAGDDWCHFSVRLARSRAHRQAKGAVLGYEDEKFSYLAMARMEVTLGLAQDRIIAPPKSTKYSVVLPVCSTRGGRLELPVKKGSSAYKKARKLKWGQVAAGIVEV